MVALVVHWFILVFVVEIEYSIGWELCGGQAAQASLVHHKNPFPATAHNFDSHAKV